MEIDIGREVFAKTSAHQGGGVGAMTPGSYISVGLLSSRLPLLQYQCILDQGNVSQNAFFSDKHLLIFKYQYLFLFRARLNFNWLIRIKNALCRWGIFCLLPRSTHRRSIYDTSTSLTSGVKPPILVYLYGDYGVNIFKWLIYVLNVVTIWTNTTTPVSAGVCSFV